jgi:hypothetical protein
MMISGECDVHFDVGWFTSPGKTDVEIATLLCLPAAIGEKPFEDIGRPG